MTIVHHLSVGDTLTPVGATLKQRNTSGVLAAVNLTGKTVKFRMVDDAGTVVVNDAAATVVTAESGTVQYDFAAGDVDTAGTYWGWFLVYSGSEFDTFPAEGRALKIIIHSAA